MLLNQIVWYTTPPSCKPFITCLTPMSHPPPPAPTPPPLSIISVHDRRYNAQLSAHQYACEHADGQAAWYTAQTIAASGLDNWLNVLFYERTRDYTDAYTRYVINGGQQNNVPADSQQTAASNGQQHHDGVSTKVEPAAPVSRDSSTSIPASIKLLTPQKTALVLPDNTAVSQPSAGVPSRQSVSSSASAPPVLPAYTSPLRTFMPIKAEPITPTAPHDTSVTAPVTQSAPTVTDTPDIQTIYENISNKRHKPSHIKPEPPHSPRSLTASPRQSRGDSPPRLKPVPRAQPLNTSFDITPQPSSPTHHTPKSTLFELGFFAATRDDNQQLQWTCQLRCFKPRPASYPVSDNFDKLISHLQDYHAQQYEVYMEQHTQ